MTEISIADARRLFLDRQGLLYNPAFGRGKAGTLRTIEQLGYVQIDTISVVDRAHHHVLKTRVPNYSEKMLDQLLQKDRAIFEYWSHAAAYLPIKDYRYYRPMMDGWHKRKSWDKKLAKEIRRRIATEGPLQSRDFEDPRGKNNNGWWDWKPAKLALEHMFLSGQIMVTRREGFQKVFDLTENVLPAQLDTSMPNHDEWIRFIVLRQLQALAIGTLNDISHARTTLGKFTGHAIRSEVKSALHALAEEGQVAIIQARNSTKEVWYADPVALKRLPLKLGKRRLQILSPFDNLVINRARLITLFGFDYQLECYVPASKRKFGYFCLPILWGDELVGRIDAKAVRDKHLLEVRRVFLEPGTKRQTERHVRLRDALNTGLAEFATKNQCDTVDIGEVIYR
ncbi:MAG: crosslink repair DNA glycosylase YcaQ family protein [Pseudomonadales bacterium]